MHDNFFRSDCIFSKLCFVRHRFLYVHQNLAKNLNFFAKNSTKCYNFAIDIFRKYPLIPEQAVTMSELRSKRDELLFLIIKFLYINNIKNFKQMKKNRCILREYSAKLAMIIVLAVVLPLVACVKEPEAPTGNITMTTKGSEVLFYVGKSASRDVNFSISWGDGQRSDIADAISHGGEDGVFEFSRSFSDNRSERRIIIIGNIERLEVRRNELTALDISRNNALKWLFCNNNQLTEINLSRNTALEVLSIDFNRLTSLDVSRNTALRSLDVSNNQLTSLDVSNNTALRGLFIARNQFTASALNDLFRTLPDLTGLIGNEGESIGPYLGRIYMRTKWPEFDGPAVYECDHSIALNKGWEFRTY